MGFEPLTPLGSRGIFVPGSAVYQASLRAREFQSSSTLRQGGSAGVGGAAASSPGPAGDTPAHAVPRSAGDPTGRAVLSPGGCQRPGTARVAPGTRQMSGGDTWKVQAFDPYLF